MPRRCARLAGSTVLTAALSGCIGLDGPVEPQVEQGFELTRSFLEQSTTQVENGPAVESPSRWVSDIRNAGAPARTVTFRLDLLDGDRVVWSGTATAQDVQQQEDVRVVYASGEPVPDGSHFLEWSVQAVER